MIEETPPDELFSACRFYADGQYEYVCRFVSARQAYEAAWQCATNSGALMGTTVRVIITDPMDRTSWEWIHGKGVVFPEGWTLDGPPAKNTPAHSLPEVTTTEGSDQAGAFGVRQ